jgi:hypothetical protein
MQLLIFTGKFHCSVEGIPALFVLAQVAQVGVVIPVGGQPPLQLREARMQRQPPVDDNRIPRLALLEGRGLTEFGNSRL